jgi:hypothetical protein
MGFARRHESGARRSGGSDSGSTSSPYAAFSMLSAAATQNGTRGPKPPSSPPIAGPSTKPMPNAAPSRAKPAARSGSGVTSATYAPAAVMLAAVRPATTRPTSSHVTFGASAIST